jgi:hypothetical protein
MVLTTKRRLKVMRTHIGIKTVDITREWETSVPACGHARVYIGEM